jgi:hypothetical protein
MRNSEYAVYNRSEYHEFVIPGRRKPVVESEVGGLLVDEGWSLVDWII